MNIRMKLGLIVGSLTFLLMASAALSFVLAKRIDDDVQNLGRVVAPLKEAALEMRISVGESTKSIIQYSTERDTRHILSFLETKNDFERALENYTSLAETEKERDAGLEIGQIHDGFGELSDKIIGVTNSIQASLERLSNDVGNLEEILNDQLEVRIDRNARDGLPKLEAVLNMDSRVNEAFLAVQSYIASPEPTFRQTRREKEQEFKEFESVFLSSQLSLEEQNLVRVIDTVFLDAEIMGKRVMDQVDEQRSLILSLAEGLEEIERIVNDDVQPLIIAETLDALESAESSVDIAKFSVFVLIALGILFGAGAALIVARQIVSPIMSLTNAAVELGRGNLGVRARVGSADEIGSLATSFNQMAAARQMTEEQRVLLINELGKRNSELAQLDELKDNFLSSVSHELRTPLTAIKGSAEILLDDEGVTEDIQKQFLTIINIESDRLTRLINDILDLARYESGQEQWNDQSNSMSEIVGSAVSGIRSLAIQNDLDLDVSLDDDLAEVWCDQDKINQVLTNLLSNAIKFTPKKGEIRVSAKEVFNSEVASDGRVIEVTVADNGVGVASSELDEIFQKFKQVGDTPSDVQKGTGLGLPICREIVDHYGGKIWAESVPGMGSEFIFTLPVNKHGGRLDEPVPEESGPPLTTSI